MSDLFGNHIVGFPTRWLKCNNTWCKANMHFRHNLKAILLLIKMAIQCWHSIKFIYTLTKDAVQIALTSTTVLLEIPSDAYSKT